MSAHESPFSSERSGEKIAAIWLSLLPNLKSTPKTWLCGLFHDTRLLMAAPRDLLAAAGVQDARLLEAMTSSMLKEKAASIYERTLQSGAVVICLSDPEYPHLLRQIPDPPVVLYRKGQPLKGRCLAVVGSRRATGYGLSMAERLSTELAHAGFTIVSGLARGIDTAAHCGALQAGGCTTAVLANGLEQVYPPENAKLAERIMERGQLLTECPPDMPPAPFRFPVRNRIISGLSEAVLVVEAGERSGSLITVQSAIEQGRDVHAVPGNATSLCSRGCNRLIREGAGLVQDAADLLESLGTVFLSSGVHWSGYPSSGMKNTLVSAEPLTERRSAVRTESGSTWKERSSGLTVPESIIAGRLQREELSVDQLCGQSGLSPAEVRQVLMGLELKHIIALGLDGRYRMLP